MPEIAITFQVRKLSKTYKENWKRRRFRKLWRSSDKFLGMYKITYMGKAVCMPKKYYSINVSSLVDLKTLHKQQ